MIYFNRRKEENQFIIICDADKLNIDNLETFLKSKDIKEWAYIIHDKESIPSYYIYLNYGKYRINSDNIARSLLSDVIYCLSIAKVKCCKADIIIYLLDLADIQYSVDDLHANFDFKKEIENLKIN